jgi:hypothetical protein
MTSGSRVSFPFSVLFTSLHLEIQCLYYRHTHKGNWDRFLASLIEYLLRPWETKGYDHMCGHKAYSCSEEMGHNWLHHGLAPKFQFHNCKAARYSSHCTLNPSCPKITSPSHPDHHFSSSFLTSPSCRGTIVLRRRLQGLLFWALSSTLITENVSQKCD